MILYMIALFFDGLLKSTWLNIHLWIWNLAWQFHYNYLSDIFLFKFWFCFQTRHFWIHTYQNSATFGPSCVIFFYFKRNFSLSNSLESRLPFVFLRAPTILRNIVTFFFPLQFFFNKNPFFNFCYCFIAIIRVCYRVWCIFLSVLSFFCLNLTIFLLEELHVFWVLISAENTVIVRCIGFPSIWTY